MQGAGEFECKYACKPENYDECECECGCGCGCECECEGVSMSVGVGLRDLS